MSAHSGECEHADVGSLCDCDCAGARHAVARTKGAVSGAGAVSKRAQRIAHRDGRAPVVNNQAVPNGKGRPGTPPDKAPDKPPVVKPPVVKPPVVPPVVPPPVVKVRKPATKVVSAQRPVLLSPATTAKIKDARGALPTDRGGWQDAARVPLTRSQKAKLQVQLDMYRRFADEAKAAQDEHLRRFALEVVSQEFTGKQKPGYRQYKSTDPDFEQTMMDFAHHRILDPGNEKWAAEQNDLGATTYRSRVNLDTAERAFADAIKGNYPVDKTTRLAMPSKQLAAHLDRVQDVGRAALADARAQWSRNPPAEVVAARKTLDDYQQYVKDKDTLNQLWGDATMGRRPMWQGSALRDFEDFELAMNRLRDDNAPLIKAQNDAQRTVAAHESKVLRDMIAAHRPMGGVTHDATAGLDPIPTYGNKPARADWRKRLTAAEQYYPDAWLQTSAAKPMTVGSSDRAYYRPSQGAHPGLLSMPATGSARDREGYDGALPDRTAETNIHELGHRMEEMIPGLTHLEFALVRKHATRGDGTVEKVDRLPGYNPSEVGQPDEWRNVYTGKSYETTGNRTRPGDEAWEAFQVGIQDLFGRSSHRFGKRGDDDELQAFVLGALLLLG
jgi:hypothetical protein